MTDQQRVNVLVVDDKHENLLALESILKSPELNVVRAASGNEALAALLEGDFACILLDVQMPGMDGFELARIIRGDNRTRLIPIIFSSGHQRAQTDIFKGYETGAVDYLLKPLDPIIVRSKVHVFAELYRKDVALQSARSAVAEYARELQNSNVELEKRVADRMKELSSSQTQIAQLQKMDAIGSLAGGVAHDFNNVLAAINMYCDLAQDEIKMDDIEAPERVIGAINEIRSVASRGAALTRQLLIFSRKQIVQPRNVKLNDIVDGMLRMLIRLIGANIQVSTKLEQQLDLIRADPSQIEQVILNLVVNARDAMAMGGQITIETANIYLKKDFTDLHLQAQPGPHVVLIVSDTGSGMDETARAHLFEPFFTTKPIGKGTGLGLSTVYGIVKQTNGSIWVDSEIGKGTVFKIYFPTVEGSFVIPETATHIKNTGANPSETILLVEDDERLRSLYAKALMRRGYRVMTASNGKEALEAVAGQLGKINLLITDVMMPVMGGVELTRRALDIEPRLQILFMSGYANEPVDEQKEIAQRRTYFIQKPFDTDALMSKIHEVLVG
jgi:two-component system cell cycle sensor histidine kinase/response regulator CckA